MAGLGNVDGGNPVRDAVKKAFEATKDAVIEVEKANVRGAKKLIRTASDLAVKDLTILTLGGIQYQAGKLIGKAVKNKQEAQQEAQESMNESMGFEKSEKEYVPPYERTDR